MRILIVEDEPLAAQDLQNALHGIDSAIEIVAVIPGVTASKKWLAANEAPDLILSDIQLSDGISFDIYENNPPPCPIIFTTAYDEYAIRAFKLNSIDYLLKPVNRGELQAALDKYRSLQTGLVYSQQVTSLHEGWQQAGKKYKERFLAVHRNSLVPFQVSEIAFFHKEELIYLHTANNEKYIAEHTTMDEIESLVDPKLFFRVNRQFLLHINFVGRLKSTAKGMCIEVKSPFDLQIDMSREKITSFKQWLA